MGRKNNLNLNNSFESKIREIIDNLREKHHGKKISKSSVTNELEIPYSTFNDRLDKNKIDFSKL